MLPFNKDGSWRMLSTIGHVDGTGTDILTDPGVANTKGAWKQLTGSLTRNAAGLWVMPLIFTGVNHSFLIDIGIGTGAAPSKTLISNLLLSLGVAGYKGDPLPFPLALSSPNNLWARYQVDTAVATVVKCWINPYRSSISGGESLARVQTIGASSSAASKGTNVSPGTSVGVAGSWTDLSPVVSYHTKFIVWLFGNALNYSFSISNAYLFELGVKNTNGNIYVKTSMILRLSSPMGTPVPGGVWMPIHIPMGSTLSCRATPLESTTVTDFDTVVYCVS